MIDLSQLITAQDKQAQAAAAVKAARDAIVSGFRADREGFLNRLAGIGFAAQVGGRPDIVQQVLAVRQGLLDLTTQPAVLAATTEATIKQAMLAQYAALLTGASAEVKAVFKGLNK